MWHKINKRTLETAVMVFNLFATQRYAYNTGTIKKLQISEARLGNQEVYFWGTTLKSS